MTALDGGDHSAATCYTDKSPSRAAGT